jgi:hypothetical protein
MKEFQFRSPGFPYSGEKVEVEYLPKSGGCDLWHPYLGRIIILEYRPIITI